VKLESFHFRSFLVRSTACVGIDDHSLTTVFLAELRSVQLHFEE
jgi:hypothetical protein